MGDYNIIVPIIYFSLLIISSLFVHYLVKRILTSYIAKKLLTENKPADLISVLEIINKKFSYVIIPVILLTISPLIPQITPPFLSLIQKISICCIILFIATIVSCIIGIVGERYKSLLKDKPVKVYIQISKIVTYVIAGLLILATLLNQSPLLIFSGLGAILAIVILVFQDTILSLIAGIQISSTNMVKIGDWVELPTLGADGEVTDIALHTVSIKNWDNTITNVPIRKLVSDAFKNWSHMQQSGARRIKKALIIDQESIRFLTNEELQEIGKLRHLKGYIKQKTAEIEAWNKQLGEDGQVISNTRRLTNLGTFRAYIANYLPSHPNICKDRTAIAKLQNPTAQGLPLEVYCFCNQTNSVPYEAIQADIFEHLYSILPIFGLRIFQGPTGYSLQEGLISKTNKSIDSTK